MAARRTTFLPYRPKTILNKSKRADHWFWTRYSAYPYLGCQHGCEFCYCRERKYSPFDDIADFTHVIRVKENAPELLRRALEHAPVDGIFTGDYQPAERKFQLSRRMLEVCYDLGFPVFVLSRSPLVLRDLDLLQAIQARARATVTFSVIATPESPNYPRVQQLERLAPSAEKRFAAMEKLAAAGISTGVCLMPVLPGLCDDPANLDAVVRWTAGHGGSFVLAGGLTLADQQKDYFLGALEQRFPDLLDLYRAAYLPGSYGMDRAWNLRLIRQVREACQRHGIHDRQPRPIIPGDKRTLNKRVEEALAERLYALELEPAPEWKQWAYRKAAWAVADLEQDLGLVVRSMGQKGVESLPGVTPDLASEIVGLVQQLKPVAG